MKSANALTFGAAIDANANVLFSAAYREMGLVRAFIALADAGTCARGEPTWLPK